MLLRKHLNLQDVSLKMESDTTGKFAGYASVFGGVDSYGDTIAKGAFDYSLRTNGKPKMFLEHGAFNMFAAGAAGLPIGKWTVAKEDDHGLYVEGELTLGMSLAQDVYAAMKHGTMDGLSIGGHVKKGDYDETDTGRVIRRWTSLAEISPVAFPADGAARVDGGSIKSAEFGEAVAEAIADIESVRDLERFLLDAGGLTKGAAVALVARARELFGVGDPAEQQTKAMNDVLAKLTRIAG
jgi:HK97 family phage prohead protease